MLGEYLKAARGARSQGEVAARIDMDQAEWSKWETGKRSRPSPEQLRDFAYALGVPLRNVALAYAGILPESSGSAVASVATPGVFIPLPANLDVDEGEVRLTQRILARMALAIVEEEREFVREAVEAGIVAPDGTPPHGARARRSRASRSG